MIVDAPRSTKRSLNSPTAGLEAIPDVASDPPHSIPISSSEISHHSFLTRPACAASSLAALVAFSMVFKVPPSSWIPKDTTGLSVIFWIFSLNCLCPTVSHPSPMITTPYTLGLHANPVKIFWDMAVLSATSEHPVLNTIFTAPLTWLATIRLDSLPQAHAGRISTWLRIPTLPSERRYPRNWIFSPFPSLRIITGSSSVSSTSSLS